MTVIPTRDGYDRWSGIYDQEDNALIALEERFFPELIGPAAGLDVLDIGGGTGRHAIPLVAAGARVTLVDFSEKMVSQARRKTGAEAIGFICQDLSNGLVLRASQFDLVLCCLVLDHIQDLKGLFGEMKRVCRPTGAICLSVMHPAMNLVGVQARFNDPQTGEKMYPRSLTHSIADYVMAAGAAGLQIERISEHVVDEVLMASSVRARKYSGYPLLLLLKLRPLFEIHRKGS
jgi:malonyl-CoA O-methyltransferase